MDNGDNCNNYGDHKCDGHAGVGVGHPGRFPGVCPGQKGHEQGQVVARTEQARGGSFGSPFFVFVRRASRDGNMEIMNSVMGVDLWGGAIVDIKMAMLCVVGLMIIIVGMDKLLDVLESPWYKKRQEKARHDRVENYQDTDDKKAERATWKFKE